MSFATTALVTLIVYKLLLLGIGLWASRRTKNQSDFVLAGRELGPIVAALSYSASSSSAWTLLGFSGYAYAVGLSAAWLALGSLSGALIAWWWIAPRLRRTAEQQQLMTLTDFIVSGSSGVGRKRLVWASSLIILCSFAFYVAAQFQAAGSSFATTFEVNQAQAILFGGFIIMLYTFIGGFWAVSLTDAVQGTLMAAVAIVLPAVAWQAAGGWEGLQAGLNSSQLSWTASNAGLFTIGLVLGSLALGLGTYGQPHLLNRFMALRDERALNQAKWITAGWYVIVFGGMFVLGLCGNVLFPMADNSENVFFLTSQSLLPPVLAAVVLAGTLSAIMSTADSQLLVAASVMSHDLAPSHSARARSLSPLMLSRISIAALAIVAVLLAIYLPASIFSRVLFAWSALGAAFGPLVICKLSGRTVSSETALAAILIGFASSVMLYLLPNTVGDIAERVLPFTLGACILAKGIVGAKAGKP